MSFQVHIFIKLMLTVFTVLGIGLLGTGHNASMAQANGKPDTKQAAPVIIELFTSQGCSSCPPADRLLDDIAREIPHALTIGCHVTYWDHLGWNDTFGQESCNTRQRYYALSQKQKNVYTPQMIVNGQDGFVGYNRRGVLSAIRSPENPSVRTIAIDVDVRQDRAVLHLPSLKIKQNTGQKTRNQANKNTTGETPENNNTPTNEDSPYALWLFGISPSTENKISNGENKGRTVHTASPAQYLKFAGKWNGEARTLSILLPSVASKRTGSTAQKIIVLAQKDGHGPIVAAGHYTFFINAPDKNAPR